LTGVIPVFQFTVRHAAESGCYSKGLFADREASRPTAAIDSCARCPPNFPHTAGLSSYPRRRRPALWDSTALTTGP